MTKFFFARKKERTSSQKGQPLKRVAPVWRERISIYGLIVALLIGFGFMGIWSWNNGMISRAIDQTKWRLIAFSGSLGFKVEDVLVVGRSQTTKEALLDAVRLAYGAPILAYDLEEARKRIEVLPWVARTTVERMLPNTILLSVVERQPLALWQRDGRFEVIDREGEVISKQSIEKFSDLLVVVGSDAPKNTAALLDVLKTQPQLMDLAISAVRVGKRRWNIRLKGDIDIRLPAERVKAAWSRLAEFQRRHGILGGDVKLLDLRLPGRVIIRKNKEVQEIMIKQGRDT